MLRIKKRLMHSAYKLLKLVPLFMLCALASTTIFAMEGVQEDENIIRQRRLSVQEFDGGNSVAPKTDVTVALKEGAPIGLFNRDLEHPTRKKLDYLLERVIQHTENSRLLQKERPPFRTGILIYTPPEEKAEAEKSVGSWDNHFIFLQALDEQLFLKKRSKKTIAAQVLWMLEGPMGPIGAAALVPYLSANLLTFLPEAGSASLANFITVCVLAGIPTIRQMYERMGKFAGYFFDDPDFSPSKDDQKPHILKLEKHFGKYYSISIPRWGTLFSFFNATVRALPLLFLFWGEETPFTTPRDVLSGPLALLYFEKAFEESQQVVRDIANKRWTEEIHMLAEKKAILKDRINEFKSRINANASDNLVNKLYEIIQAELAAKLKDKESPTTLPQMDEENLLTHKEKKAEEKRETISIASLFFVRRDAPALYQQAAESVERYYTLLHVRAEEEKEKVEIELEIEEEKKKAAEEELKNLSEDAAKLAQSKPQELINLIGDIDNLPRKTNARYLLETLAVYLQGASSTGRFIVTQWAVGAILTYWGASPEIALGAGISVATVDWVCRAVSEWSVQEETFLSVRHFASRNTDFWPLRWVTTVVSAFPSFFFTLPPIAIIFRVFGDNVPTFIKVLFAIATAPSEFSSFFKFFTEKYGNIITGVATLGMPSTEKPEPSIKASKGWRKSTKEWLATKRKRAWLNMKANQLLKSIDAFDQATTEQLYHLTQEGL